MGANLPPLRDLLRGGSQKNGQKSAIDVAFNL